MGSIPTPDTHKVLLVVSLSDMWYKVMAVNSFIFWPLSFIFLIYAVGRTVIFFQWKILVLALIIFGIATIVQIILGFIND